MVASGMIYPWIGARLHGVLDDLVVLTYLVGSYLFGLHGAALAVAVGGALVHFLLARTTDYPEGQLKLIRFRTHAYIELTEGLVVLTASAVVGAVALPQRLFLVGLGLSQLVAFSFSNYEWPVAEKTRAVPSSL
jgi:hypothetical protein